MKLQQIIKKALAYVKIGRPEGYDEMALWMEKMLPAEKRKLEKLSNSQREAWLHKNYPDDFKFWGKGELAQYFRDEWGFNAEINAKSKGKRKARRLTLRDIKTPHWMKLIAQDVANDRVDQAWDMEVPEEILERPTEDYVNRGDVEDVVINYMGDEWTNEEDKEMDKVIDAITKIAEENWKSRSALTKKRLLELRKELMKI